jgi:hypothetical protein
MAGAAGHRPCGGVLVLGRIECTTGPHWRGINGLAERGCPGALETRVPLGQFEASWLGSLGRLGSFVPPLARQFSFSFEAFRGPLVQDCCPMLSLFFWPHFNRGLGPVRVDPDDMPS